MVVVVPRRVKDKAPGRGGGRTRKVSWLGSYFIEIIKHNTENHREAPSYTEKIQQYHLCEMLFLYTRISPPISLYFFVFLRVLYNLNRTPTFTGTNVVLSVLVNPTPNFPSRKKLILLPEGISTPAPKRN